MKNGSTVTTIKRARHVDVLTPRNLLLALVIGTAFISYLGIKNPVIQARYLFNIEKILSQRQYYRLFTSGFLHADFLHLGLNMYTLYAFAPVLIKLLGFQSFLLVYLGSIIGGGLLSLYLNRFRSQYSALGASGGVSGVLLASIVLFPESKIYLFLIPIGIPGYIFALLYIGYSLFGMAKQGSNIGHDAHLGGMLSGILLLVAFKVEVLYVSGWLVVSILVPLGVLFYLVHRRPQALTMTFPDNIRYLLSVSKPKRK